MEQLMYLVMISPIVLGVVAILSKLVNKIKLE